MKKIFLATLTFLGLFLISSYKSAHAATLYWVGNDGANASVASNWKTTNPATCGSGDASAIPGSSDTMRFDADCDNGTVVDSSFSSTVSAVTIDSGYSGTITLSNPLTVTTSYSQVAGTFTAGSQTLDIDGTYSLTGGAFTASSTNTYVGSTFTISGTPTFNANGGTFTFDTSVATLTCVSSSLPAFNLVIINTSTIANTKTITSNCSLPLGGTPTITRVLLQGTLTGSGTLTENSSFDIDGTSATLTGFSGLVVNGQFGGSTNATLNLSAYTTVDFNDNFSFSSGTFTASTGTMTFAKAFTLSGTVVFNANGGTVTFDSSGANTIACNNATFNLVTFNNTATKTISSNCSLPLGASPTLAGSGSVTVNGGTLSGTGTLTKTSATLTLQSGSSTLSGFSGLSVNALTVSGATVDLSSYSTFTAGSTVALSSGSLTLPSGADLNGALTISTGTFNAPSGTMTLAGALTISGSPTFNANGGTFTFDGGGGTLACNNIIFNRVTFEQTSSTKTVNSDCSFPLGNNPTMARAVTLNGILSGTGTLTTTAGTLTLNSGATLSGFTGLDTNLTVAGATSDMSSYTTVLLGTFTLSSGTFTAAPTMRINNWARSGGTFNHNNGTVTLYINNSTISGSTIFYNLTKVANTNVTVTFTANTTQTIQGTLTLTATLGAKLSLRSSTTGLQYSLNATGGRILSNLDVQDGNGIGNTYVCSSCINSGNNTNWSFINGSSIQFSLNYPSGDSHITNTNPTYRWSKATLNNNSAITKYELYIQPKDSEDQNTGTALYIDNIAPFVGDNKQYQYNPTYILYDDGDYLNLTPNNYILPVGRYNFRVVAHDSAGNIVENSYNFWVDVTTSNTKTTTFIALTKYTNRSLNTSHIESTLDHQVEPIQKDSNKETPTPQPVSNHEAQPYNNIAILSIVAIMAGAGLIWIPKILKRKQK